jgi:hypothetical protein
MRALTPVERLLVCQATSTRVRSMAMAGIRLRHPLADEREQKLLLAEVLYGAEARRRLEKRLEVSAPSANEILDVCVRLGRAFDDLGIRYLIGGKCRELGRR